jgi:hypothetical protein
MMDGRHGKKRKSASLTLLITMVSRRLVNPRAEPGVI